MITHPDVALEGLVRESQLASASIEFCLGQRGDGPVAHARGRDSNLGRDGVGHEGIHGLVAQLGEHMRLLRVIRTNVSVGERVEGGERRHGGLLRCQVSNDGTAGERGAGVPRRAKGLSGNKGEASRGHGDGQLADDDDEDDEECRAWCVCTGG